MRVVVPLVRVDPLVAVPDWRVTGVVVDVEPVALRVEVLLPEVLVWFAVPEVLPVEAVPEVLVVDLFAPLVPVVPVVPRVGVLVVRVLVPVVVPEVVLRELVLVEGEEVDVEPVVLRADVLLPDVLVWVWVLVWVVLPEVLVCEPDHVLLFWVEVDVFLFCVEVLLVDVDDVRVCVEALLVGVDVLLCDVEFVDLEEEVFPPDLVWDVFPPDVDLLTCASMSLGVAVTAKIANKDRIKFFSVFIPQ